MNKKLLTTISAVLLAGSGAAQAIDFSVNGTAAGTIADAQSFDWHVTSFLAKGGNEAFANFLSGGPDSGNLFQVYTMAVLDTITDGNGVATDLRSRSDEITMILGYTEKVTGASLINSGGGLQAQFANVTSAPVFFQILYDASKNANDLGGSGFNDGVVIADSHTIGAASGTFTVNLQTTGPNAGQPVVDQQLDKFGPGNSVPPKDSYGPGGAAATQHTVTGQGTNGDLDLRYLGYDPNFFRNLNGAALHHLMQNVSQTLPFAGVNPSDCFITGVSGGVGTTLTHAGAETVSCNSHHDDAKYALQTTPPGVNGYVPRVGDTNGSGFSGTAGNPDFVAQTDFNASFVIPEPFSLSLMSLGLIAMGSVARASRSKKSA